MRLGRFGFKKSAGVTGIQRAFTALVGGANTNNLIVCNDQFGGVIVLGAQASGYFSCGPKLSPDRTKVAVGVNAARKVAVYNVAGASFVDVGAFAQAPDGSYAWAVAFNPTGTRLAVGVYNASQYIIKVYNTSTWAMVAQILVENVGSAAYDLAYSADGSRLIMSRFDYVAYYTVSGDAYTLAQYQPARLSGAGNVVAICPISATRVACLSRDSKLWVHDMTTQANTAADFHPTTDTGHNGMALSPDKTKLAVYAINYGLTIYTVNASAPSLTRVNSTPYSGQLFAGFAFSPDGTKALGVGSGGAFNMNPLANPPSNSGSLFAGAYTSVPPAQFGGQNCVHSGVY